MTIDMQKFRDSLQEKIVYHGKQIKECRSDPEAAGSVIIQTALMEVAMALDEAVVKESVDSNPEKD